MKKFILYTKVFYLPLIVLSLGFLVVFSVLFWFVCAKTNWLIIPNSFVDIGIACISFVLPIIFMRKRIALFDSSNMTTLDGLFYLLCTLAIAIPSVASHHYLLSKSGDLTIVSNPASIDLGSPSLYYQIDSVCFDKSLMKSDWTATISGRKREHLNLDGLFAMPMLSTRTIQPWR